jgi:hypothetical protein
MTRGLTANMVTAAQAASGEIFYLYELEFSGGTLRYTTAPNDMSWDGQTWVSIGGHLRFEGVKESRDLTGQSVRVILDGVNQAVISALLGQNYIGRTAKIYLGHIASTGAITTDPYLLFSGYLNSAFRVEEQPNETCRVSTSLVSFLARFKQQRGIKASVASHEDIFAGDTFWQHITEIPVKVWWGQEPVSTRGGGVGDWDTGEEDRREAIP